ncbi:14159_t:CDS:1, partial [Dentiscutata erythropus]
SIQALTMTNKNLNLNSPVLPNNEQLELPPLYTFPLLQNPSNLINPVEQNSIIYLLLYYNSFIQALTMTNENLNLNPSVLLINNEQLGLLSLYSFSLSQNNLINLAKQNSNSAINIPEPSFLSNAIPISSIFDSDINIPEFFSSSIAMPVFGISDSIIANAVSDISNSVIKMLAPSMDFRS